MKDFLQIAIGSVVAGIAVAVPLMLIGLLVVACVDFPRAYPTYADAERAEMVAKGWVPEFVPEDATDIRMKQGMSPDYVQIEFSSESDLEPRLAEFDRIVSTQLAQMRNPPYSYWTSIGLIWARTTGVYWHCSSGKPGVLWIADGGHAYYEWPAYGTGLRCSASASAAINP